MGLIESPKKKEKTNEHGDIPRGINEEIRNVFDKSPSWSSPLHHYGKWTCIVKKILPYLMSHPVVESVPKDEI